MIKKKVCLLGAFSVGKTSLVQRFVNSLFSERYLTTVGVKVDKKSVQVGAEQVDLLLWDIHGEDITQNIAPSYLRGSSGYILVVDGTRRETLSTALNIAAHVPRPEAANMPMVLAINKADLEAEWELDDQRLDALERQGWLVCRTSAKTGAGVEDAFVRLAGALIQN